jgi:hypothetical protein
MQKGISHATTPMGFPHRSQEGFGWGYLVQVLDWYTMKIVDYYAGMPCTARQWLEALDISLNR